MFNVLACDDEPSALEYICSMVALRCPGFQIMATAENSRQCLELLKTRQPDILLTDVKMPIMNGIELARHVQRDYPGILTVIISGHQEFDYARGALQSGVVDYLLKPLTPAAFTEAFDRLRVILGERLLQRRNKLLSALSNNVHIDPEELRRCFPDANYDCVLARRNGLPQRFRHNAPPEIYKIEDSFLSIFGRDEMERICLRPAFNNLEDYAQSIMDSERETGAYVTAVATRNPFPIEQFAGMLQRMYRALDMLTVIGATQLVYLEDPFNRARQPLSFDYESLKKLEWCLDTGSRELASGELRRLMLDWEQRHMPQLWVEWQLRYVLYLAGRAGGAAVSEHLLDDAFYSITSMAGMIDYMTELLFSDAPFVPDSERKSDAEEKFERIRAYLRANLSEPHSIQSVSNHFGISQSYLSKLFHRYWGKSFSVYLTEIRMEHACELLRSESGAFVKDVAAMAGYSDPLYFSRIFRAYVGKSPKEYMGAK